MTTIPHYFLPRIAAALAAVAFCATTAQAADDGKTGKAAGAARGAQPGLAQDLRSDQSSQSKIEDIDRQIEQTWKTVEEIKMSAQNLKIAHGRIKDALDNNDCRVGAKIIESLNRSREQLTRLGASLDSQCKDIDARTQKSLAQACATERDNLKGETATLNRQQEQVYGMCPDLRKQ